MFGIKLNWFLLIYNINNRGRTNYVRTHRNDFQEPLKKHHVDLKTRPQSMQKGRQYKDLKTWQPHPCSGVCILGNKFRNYNSWQYLLQKAIPTNLNKFGLISSQQGIEGCQGSQNMLYSSIDLKLLR